ncbi:MAG: ABC transporter substrate-binding protein, partial [Rhizobiaceae bacterium]|nr:ABC transporter substrate-binding protein [Hyphomicrobiales bacterium]NRB32544.1 ABC transporter substrate-binding protein [Rhizobiaceae bacterium]
MSMIRRLARAAMIAAVSAMPAIAQAASLTISVGFGPNAETPDPRSGYNGWMSNQTGVTETLMGIDYDLKLYPRLAEKIDQAAPTKWRVT